jgi:cell wall-associated NlpC family hydrolase
MNQILNRYISPAYKYCFEQGPSVVRNREEALRNGINCISLAHLVLKDLFGYELSPELHCIELYRDRAHFEEIESIEQMTKGDLVWFGLANPAINIEDFEPEYNDNYLINHPDCALKHVGIYTGEKGSCRDYQILHSTPYEGTNIVWSLHRFSSYIRYEKLYGITRLRKGII